MSAADLDEWEDAISAHATPEMQQCYSTPRGDEVKHALSKVVKIATSGADIIGIATARRARRKTAYIAILTWRVVVLHPSRASDVPRAAVQHRR